MKAKSKKRGKSTSAVSIHTTPFGVWLLVNDVEYFLSFKQFPWFKNAKLGDVHNVRLESANHLYWPKLDVDLTVDSLTDVEKYPLIAK